MHTSEQCPSKNLIFSVSTLFSMIHFSQAMISLQIQVSNSKVAMCCRVEVLRSIDGRANFQIIMISLRERALYKDRQRKLFQFFLKLEYMNVLFNPLQYEAKIIIFVGSLLTTQPPGMLIWVSRQIVDMGEQVAWLCYVLSVF